jgi:hypothetical protein
MSQTKNNPIVLTATSFRNMGTPKALKKPRGRFYLAQLLLGVQ